MDKTLVLKFGGASLANAAQFDAISTLILKRREEYERCLIVVSAMGKTTDELIGLAKSVNSAPPQREMDMLVSVGERISMSLLAMALAKHGTSAISFTGSQSGIITSATHTDAKIVDVRPHRILKALEEQKIVIVAGFQGVSASGEITTLGRGGSDTTAVALAVALRAEKVEFYKDVPGIFDADPKSNPTASPRAFLTYDEAIEIVDRGAKILHKRSLLLAQVNHVPLHVLSFKEEQSLATGTVIHSQPRGIRAPLYEV